MILKNIFFNFSTFYRDLSSNQLSTLHKDTFKSLSHLTVLDMASNELDFIPRDLFYDIDSLTKLQVFT